jgi:FAD/FMN-containing dehydrogenase
LVVQGGGCLTVGVAGLITGGGFGSLSKAFGLAAGNLLEAGVVTADGHVKLANACANPDLFWALKGGRSGFGVVTRLTLRTHDLPEVIGWVNATIVATSDDAYRRLIARPRQDQKALAVKQTRGRLRGGRLLRSCMRY